MTKTMRMLTIEEMTENQRKLYECADSFYKAGYATLIEAIEALIAIGVIIEA